MFNLKAKGHTLCARVLFGSLALVLMLLVTGNIASAQDEGHKDSYATRDAKDYSIEIIGEYAVITLKGIGKLITYKSQADSMIEHKKNGKRLRFWYCKKCGLIMGHSVVKKKGADEQPIE